MTAEFAIDFIPRRMKELGYGIEYIVRWRQFQLELNGILDIDAQNEYYYLVNPGNNVEVSSKFGIYNNADTSINEAQFEHRGKIRIKNFSPLPLFVQFIQVIPNHNSILKNQ
jgi:hypothetical protein